MPPGFFFCSYSQVLRSKLSIEKHDQGTERGAWLVVNICLDFHADFNE